MTGRRMLLMLVILAASGIPAIILTATCVGRSCETSGDEIARIPFCPLPRAVKEQIVNGFREGRSPDALGVADGTPIYSDIDGLRMPWPATATFTDTRVPIMLAGAGVADDATIRQGTTLDAIAPTVGDVLDFDRPFPEVRSGRAMPDVADDERPRLVLLIAWKAVGSTELEMRRNQWPFVESLIDDGAGTLKGETGSLPLDPAATLTTIGTGGLPFQHGVTGSWVRNDAGDVVQAFGRGAPIHVIATLADDLDHRESATLVGLVASHDRDRGIVGGDWYPGEDPVDVLIGDSRVAPLAVEVQLSTGYGADGVPDVLGVVLDGSVRAMDRWTREIVREAQRATGDSTLVVVAGTGSAEASRLAVPDDGLVAAVEDAVPGDEPAVAAAVPGGLFLDQNVLREEEVTGQVAVEAMLSATGPDGERMLTDAFQGFAVSFARYC